MKELCSILAALGRPAAGPAALATLCAVRGLSLIHIFAGVRWLNPGSLTRPRGGAAGYAWLEVHPGRPLRWSQVLI